MIKGEKSKINHIENFLCPFTDMYISQGSNGAYSHKGIMANDVRGLIAGVRYPYYAPCTCKCVKVYPSSGQVMWQSVEKVLFANGRIDYATFMTAHDDSMNVKIGMIVLQGEQLGNMGAKGNAFGVHCHIQISQSKDIRWFQNQYGNYMFHHEYDLDDCYFVDHTNILKGNGGTWKKISDLCFQKQDMSSEVLFSVGTKVKFDGIFKVDILKSPISTNLFGSCLLTGVSYEDYYYERAKSYHWIPLDDFTEVDQYGNSKGQDDIIFGGISYVINKNCYEVKAVDFKTSSVKLELSGRPIWVFSKFLYKV